MENFEMLTFLGVPLFHTKPLFYALLYFIFDSCGAIRVVRFWPDSLAAFWNLSSLSSIAIPRRVEVIRKFVFCVRPVTELVFEPDSILA
jgi:hypothetical protein